MASYADIPLDDREWLEQANARDHAADFFKSFHAEHGRVPEWEEVNQAAKQHVDASFAEVAAELESVAGDVVVDDQVRTEYRARLIKVFADTCQGIYEWPEFAEG